MKLKRILIWKNPEMTKGHWAKKLGVDISYLPSSSMFKFKIFIHLIWLNILIRG